MAYFHPDTSFPFKIPIQTFPIRVAKVEKRDIWLYSEILYLHVTFNKKLTTVVLNINLVPKQSHNYSTLKLRIVFYPWFFY